MKKYYISTGTDYYKKINGKYVFEGGTSMNNNDEYEGFYVTYEEAIKVYENIELELHETQYDVYADYKQLFEFDTNLITDEDIEDDNFNIDDMKLLKDEYTKTN